MKLLVDIGNGRVKWATAAADSLRGPFPFAGMDVEGARPHAESWASAWARLTPTEVRVCNVAASDVLAGLTNWVRDYWGLSVREIRPSASAGGVRNGYNDPAALGADRWANLLGARALLGARDAVIVDAGTAVTVDGLRADGGHIGGAIFAGLAASRTGLTTAAPRLPEADAGADVPAFETMSAVTAGTRLALVGAINRVTKAVAADLDRPVWLLTGGDGEWLSSAEPGWRYAPLLTMRGLLAAGGVACAG